MSLTELSPRALRLKDILTDFVEKECIPAEHLFEKQLGRFGTPERWTTVPPVLENLKKRAKSLGLWNLFLQKEYPEGAGLTNLEYAPLCEIMGRSIHIAPEACNCAAPDTGNMEVLAKYGNAEQKAKWLTPLLNGEIRSAFAMTEPAVASSDATNIETQIRKQKDGAAYVVDGRKWWISGAGDPRCKLFILMGKTDPNSKDVHRQQTILLIPADTPGIEIVRPMTVFGYDDAPFGHCEIVFKNVVVPIENVVLGEGRGFEVMQGRLGPGRIHHCMRSLGIAERALDLTLLRISQRRAFGKLLKDQGTVLADVARSRMEIDQARFLVLSAARGIDLYGAKRAAKEIAMSKVVVPSVTAKVIDRAIQVHGAAGLGQDVPLAAWYAAVRTLRIADGPDEVHTVQIGKQELRRLEDLERKENIRKALAAKL